MMLKTKCPKCRLTIEFVDAQAGHTIYCPQCNKEVVLKLPRSTDVKLLIWTFVIVGVLGGGSVVAYKMFPGFKRTAQNMWAGIRSMFDPVGASRGR